MDTELFILEDNYNEDVKFAREGLCSYNKFSSSVPLIKDNYINLILKTKNSYVVGGLLSHTYLQYCFIVEYSI
jgi:hypothetical protein